MNTTQKIFSLLDGEKVTFTELQNLVFKAKGWKRKNVRNANGYYCTNIQNWQYDGYIVKNKTTKKYSLTKLGRLYIIDREKVLLNRRIKNLKNKVAIYKNTYASTLADLHEANYKLNRIYTTLTN